MVSECGEAQMTQKWADAPGSEGEEEPSPEALWWPGQFSGPHASGGHEFTVRRLIILVLLLYFLPEPYNHSIRQDGMFPSEVLGAQTDFSGSKPLFSSPRPFPNISP